MLYLRTIGLTDGRATGNTVSAECKVLSFHPRSLFLCNSAQPLSITSVYSLNIYLHHVLTKQHINKQRSRSYKQRQRICPTAEFTPLWQLFRQMSLMCNFVLHVHHNVRAPLVLMLLLSVFLSYSRQIQDESRDDLSTSINRCEKPVREANKCSHIHKDRK